MTVDGQILKEEKRRLACDDDVEVSVLSVMGEKVRIGIQAPQEIPVFRKEIYLEIHREDGTVEEGAPSEVNDALEGLGES